MKSIKMKSMRALCAFRVYAQTEEGERTIVNALAAMLVVGFGCFVLLVLGTILR